MKKIILVLGLLVTTSAVFTSCRDEYNAADEAENPIEEAGDEVEEAGDDVEDEF